MKAPSAFMHNRGRHCQFGNLLVLVAGASVTVLQVLFSLLLVIVKAQPALINDRDLILEPAAQRL